MATNVRKKQRALKKSLNKGLNETGLRNGADTVN